MLHSMTFLSRSGGDILDLLRNFVYESIRRKKHIEFFLDFLEFSFLSYKFSSFSISFIYFQKNLHHMRTSPDLPRNVTFVVLLKFMVIQLSGPWIPNDSARRLIFI